MNGDFISSDFLGDIQAFIFDFDGTLYDFKGLPLRLILSRPFDALKMKKDRSTRHALKGCDFGSEEKFWEEYTKLFGWKNAAQWYKEKYLFSMIDVLKKNYSSRANLADFFGKLKSAEKKIVIFSDYGMTKERMEAVGISKETQNLCDGIFSATDFGCLKPAVRPFKEIAEKIGVPCENCLVVGDRLDTDGKGAFLAGMKFIQIKTHKNDGVDWKKFAEKVLAQVES